MASEFPVEAHSLKSLGLRDAGDYEIFVAAGKSDAVVMTKDSDFLHLLEQHGSQIDAQLFVRMTTQNFEEAIRARKEGRAPEYKD